jgi:RNA recognition motif-containing protein
VKLFIGGLHNLVTTLTLEAAFKSYGVVTRCKIATDRRGRYRDFGFVDMASEQDGLRAINGLNGTNLGGKSIRVQPARSARDRRREASQSG